MINGRKLLPIKEVVGRSRYTRDYIAKLAREGVIVGAQVGRQWFVDESSLASFAEASELEAEVRRRHLSAERRRERELAHVVERQWDVIPQRPRYGRARATAATVAVLCLGVLSALAMQQVPAAVTHIAALQKTQVVEGGAGAVSEAVIHTQFVSESVTTPAPAVVFADIQTSETLTASSAVLFVPAQAATSAESIAQMFSDPVVVTFASSGAGVVTGSSSQGTTSVPFVTVPLTVAQDKVTPVMPTTP